MVITSDNKVDIYGAVKSRRRFAGAEDSSAHFHRSILFNGDGIARFYSLKKIVAQKVNRDYAIVIPDVIHQQAGQRHGIDVL